MARKIDIVATWPKKKPLSEYVAALHDAEREGLTINFRVSQLPRWEFGALRDRPARCYMVHDGYVRGFNEIKYVIYYGPNEVRNVDTLGYWPEGNYIVRDPHWYPIDTIPMKGFQGWHWFDANKDWS